MRSERDSSGESLRDLIYLDLPRAESIYSQLQGGLLGSFQTEVETRASSALKAKGDVKVFGVEHVDESGERTSRVESRVLHHALVSEVERVLFATGAAVDVNAVANDTADLGQIHSEVSSYPYLRVEGQAAFEDFARLKVIAAQFNELLEFIARASVGSLVASLPQFQELQREMQKQSLIASASEGKRKSDALIRFVEAQANARQMIFAATELEEIEPWLSEMIDLWIDLFMPNRLSLRIYPLTQSPAFHVLANLKRGMFVDDDLDTMRLAYGLYPDRPLTMFGLITSAPRADGAAFDPLPEFAEVEDIEARRDGTPEPAPVGTDTNSLQQTLDRLADEVSDEEARLAFEKAFRGVFKAEEGLEALVRFARYPAFVVQPIAVYQTIRLATLAEHDSPPQESTPGLLARFKASVFKR